MIELENQIHRLERTLELDIIVIHQGQDIRQDIGLAVSGRRAMKTKLTEWLVKPLTEDVNVPINIGDTVLMGKFKNKKQRFEKNQYFIAMCFEEKLLSSGWGFEGKNWYISEIDRQIKLENVATTWTGEVGAVCFGKNERWFSGAGNLTSGLGADVIVDNFLFICSRTNARTQCDVDATTGQPVTEHENLYAIEWSRFGNITLEKWNSRDLQWVAQ